jgi:hypothetical protein
MMNAMERSRGFDETRVEPQCAELLMHAIK